MAEIELAEARDAYSKVSGLAKHGEAKKEGAVLASDEPLQEIMRGQEDDEGIQAQLAELQRKREQLVLDAKAAKEKLADQPSRKKHRAAGDDDGVAHDPTSGEMDLDGGQASAASNQPVTQADISQTVAGAIADTNATGAKAAAAKVPSVSETSSGSKATPSGEAVALEAARAQVLASIEAKTDVLDGRKKLPG